MTTTAGITTTFTTTQSDCYASFSLYSYLNNEVLSSLKNLQNA